MSGGETELQTEGEDTLMEKVTETNCSVKKLAREHKLRLLVTKGCVIVISCSVLVVGVVLAGVLQHDYSSCDDVVEGTTLHLPLPTPTPISLQLV